MSRPKPPKESLQVRLLQTLADSQEPMGSTMLAQLTRIAHAELKPIRDDAVEIGYISITMGRKKIMLHSITESGRRWLARKTGEEALETTYPAKLATPRTHCYMHDYYVPDKHAYVRNSGLKHIKSRGI